MKKSSLYIDYALVGALLLAIAAPSFAVNAPNIGAVAGYTILDSTTPNTQARVDAQRIYNELFTGVCADLTNQDLNNQRLAPGAYCINKNSDFNGQIFLDARGDANAVFVFRVNGNLSIWPDSVVQLAGGARAENIFWVANGSISIRTNAHAAGTFIAVGPISFGRGGDNPIYDERGIVDGRLISLQGKVTVSPLVTIGFIPPLGVISSIPIIPLIPQSAPMPVGTTGLLTVINTNSHFALFVNGYRVVSGQQSVLAPATYTISEINVSSVNYGAPSYSGDCTQNGLNGIVILQAGDQKTCVVGNTVGSEIFPGLPNTGASGSYLMLFNLFGLALMGIFVWEERRFKKSVS